MDQLLLDVVYGFLMGAIIAYWHCVCLWWDGPIKRLWRTMSFKERVASLICTAMLTTMPLTYVYDLLTLMLR
jgi:predicted acylesterase/phospholipase RssA